MKMQRAALLAAFVLATGAPSIANADDARNDGNFSNGEIRYGEGRNDVFTRWDQDGDRALSEREVNEAGSTVKILEFGLARDGRPVFGRLNDDRNR
ncbi:MAG: hypothetical protein H6883_08060 [Rhodobiaceae bacterium]|nr:hypothetical protein [Rhodobiaceae bacterium]MCC0056076.1 hypothetical protein [Rhodobiaceae bacterium]